MLTTFSTPRPIGSVARDDHRLVATLDRFGLEPVVDAEQARHREAPDVGVEHADGEPLGGDRRGEVDGDRRLADAALAAGDGQDPGRRRDSVSGAFSRAFQRALSITSERSSLVISPQSMLTLRHTGMHGDPGLDVLLDLGAQRAAADRELDADRDHAVVGRPRPTEPCRA